MNVDEVDREVEAIPQEGEGIDVTGAGGDEVADAEDNGEEGNEVGEGNEDGQEAADEEDSVNDPVASRVSTYLPPYQPLPATTPSVLQALLTPQQTSNATVVPGRPRQPGEWTPELRAMARRELRAVRRQIECEDRQAAQEWGDMLFAHAAAVAGREYREVIPGQAAAEGEGEDEDEDEEQDA